MDKFNIKNSFGTFFNKIDFGMKKHSPEILITSGVIGVIASTVIACHATTKLKSITDEHNNTVDKINDMVENPTKYNNGGKTEITAEDAKKEIRIANLRTAANIVKIYAPAAILGSLSIASIFTGNNIHRKRNIALAAAYTAVDGSFKKYRERVTEKFGEELDKELRYGVKAEEIKETKVDEKGNETVETKVVKTIDPNTISDYSRFYDDGCIGWTKNSERNLWFLKQQQNWANEKLKSRGYLFLNEVYESLGIPLTETGNIVGWVYDEKNPNSDNFVDFGIYDLNNPQSRDFVNGYEKTILLDFNVEGPIYNNRKVFKK